MNYEFLGSSMEQEERVVGFTLAYHLADARTSKTELLSLDSRSTDTPLARLSLAWSSSNGVIREILVCVFQKFYLSYTT